MTDNKLTSIVARSWPERSAQLPAWARCSRAERRRSRPRRAASSARPRARTFRPRCAGHSRLYKLEADVRDCQVTGKIPSDLNGAFYRVGPDPQYPLHPTTFRSTAKAT